MGRRTSHRSNHRLFRVIDLERLIEELEREGVRRRPRIVMNNQQFTFTCGTLIFTRFDVTLTRGQYIDITCNRGPITVRIGCGNQFTQRVATYNLTSGQAVQVTCLG